MLKGVLLSATLKTKLVGGFDSHVPHTIVTRFVGDRNNPSGCLFRYMKDIRGHSTKAANKNYQCKKSALHKFCDA